jgi:hypothetical protein
MKDSSLFSFLSLLTLLTLWIISNFSFTSEKEAKAKEVEAEAIKSSYTLCNGMTFYGSNNGAIKANKYLKGKGIC